MKNLLMVLILVSVGCGDSVGPGETRLAATSEAVSPATQEGVVGEAATDEVAIVVRDSTGAPLPDFAVEWVVTVGGGSVAGGDTTNDEGVARARWTLGPVAGLQAVEARVDGVSAVTFNATAVAGDPAALATSLDSVFFDLPLDSLQITAAVADEFGNELPTGDVEWATSDSAVVLVDPSGWIRASGGGTATISATGDGLSHNVSVTVDLPLFTVPFVDLDLVADFMAFGEPLSPTHDNVAYEVVMDDDSMAVASVSSGLVERVAYQEDTDDYEIFVQYSDSWLVLYDHVVDPQVAVGQAVQPGDSLGLVAYFGNWQVGMDLVPMGRVELQVNYTGQRGRDWAWCPALFGTDDFNDAHHEALLRTSTETSTCVKQTAQP